MESNELVPVKVCRLCTKEVEEYALVNDDICERCLANERSLVNFNKQHNTDWVEKAEDAGILLWDRQPDETQVEYAIWSAYMSHFPYNPINLRQLAEEMCRSYSVVKNASMRWDFPMRLQAYLAHTNELTKIEREKGILEMNTKQRSMAERLANKLDAAIEVLDPTKISARELGGLMRVQAELQREALVDTTVVSAPAEALPQGAAAIDGNVTPLDDISEILSILGKAKKVGVRQTTEVIVDRGDE